ncbi:MAG: ABC transporter ATP-binding protein [Acidimicrobiales bacterium]
MTAPVIELRQTQLRFGSTVALDTPTLRLGPGLTAVLGRNGSGKSTLARLLATVWDPSQGVVMVDGVALVDPPSRLHLRRRLGYVAQQNGLPQRMRVADYCDYVGVLKEISPQRTRLRWTHWVLAQVGLLDRAGDRIKTLSGGMQRRLAIAQALLGGPDVLILDEPDASLDPEQRARIRTIVTHDPDRTTVAMTHHPDELAGGADRVLVLDAGRIVYDGTPGQLLQRTPSRTLEAGFRSVLPAVVNPAPGRPPPPHRHMPG